MHLTFWHSMHRRCRRAKTGAGPCEGASVSEEVAGVAVRVGASGSRSRRWLYLAGLTSSEVGFFVAQSLDPSLEMLQRMLLQVHDKGTSTPATLSWQLQTRTARSSPRMWRSGRQSQTLSTSSHRLARCVHATCACVNVHFQVWGECLAAGGYQASC